MKLVKFVPVLSFAFLVGCGGGGQSENTAGAANAPAGATASSAATSITGAGSTFAYPIYSKWAQAYQQKTGVGLNYQSIGSGGGIKQIEAGTVDFGATDKPLTVDELNKNGLAQFPGVVGGVVPVVNLDGIQPGQLKLTGAALADIYLGKVKTWNDPEIAALNPGVKLPATNISVVHRSDGSGTTFIWTDYLSKVSPDWKSKVGSDASVNWPAGVGGKGNEGVAAYVQRIKGGIGYVEYAYAKQNNMNYVQMQNQAGQYVKPDISTFQAAAGNAQWDPSKGFFLILTNQPGTQSWPITGGTFVLVHKTPANPAAVKQVLNFFDWSFKNGAAAAKSLDYVPLPDNVVTQIEQSWSQIKDKSGKPVWGGAAK